MTVHVVLLTLLVAISGIAAFEPPDPPEKPESHASNAHDEHDAVQLRDQIIDGWLEQVRNAKYMHIKAEAERKSYYTDLDAAGEPIEHVVRHYFMRGEAHMSRDALFAVFWERGPNEEYNLERPTLSLEYRDGVARERVWYPELGQYRERCWDAPIEEAAGATSYWKACALGVLAAPWPGGGPLGEAWLVDLLRQADFQPPASDDTLGLAHLSFERRPLLDPETGEKFYTRSETMSFDRDNILRSWEIAVWTAMAHNLREGGPYHITLTNQYDIALLGEMPADVRLRISSDHAPVPDPETPSRNDR